VLLCTTSFMFIPTGPLRKWTTEGQGIKGVLTVQARNNATSSFLPMPCQRGNDKRQLAARDCNPTELPTKFWGPSPVSGRRTCGHGTYRLKFQKTFWRYCKPWPTSSERLKRSVGNIVDGDILRTKSCDMEMGFDCIDGEPCSADAAKVQSHGPSLSLLPVITYSTSAVNKFLESGQSSWKITW